jgi:iron complex outermembrane recepter protein
LGLSTRGFSFSSALGVTHIVLREFVDPFIGRNYTGTRAPYTPSYELNLSAAYRQKSGLFASLAWNITGRTNYVESEDPAFSVAAHSVVSARLGFERSRWWVTTYVENLSDTRHYTLIVPGVGHGAPNARRSIGLETGVKW